jgi:threonine dehydratase
VPRRSVSGTQRIGAEAILAGMPVPEPANRHVVPFDAILAARDRLIGHVHRTPLLSSVTAGRWAGLAGTPVRDDRLHLKAEHLQKTGSFKARGMWNRIATLPPEARANGVITLSAGNAGQAYAWAGREAGVPVTVVMPVAAVRSKVEACLGYGAHVVLHGAHVGEAFAEMERLRDVKSLTFVHPFDDPAVIAGHGSAGLELLEDLPDVDVVVVGVGGGGLIAGVAAAIKEARPSTRVYGVEPERSNALSIAIERGEVVRIEPESVADGLGAPFAGLWTLAMAERYLDGIVVLDDPTILAGMRFAVERLKQVVEPAGAASLAAVLAGRIPIRPRERVAVVLSGGNIELARLGALLEAAGRLPGAVPSGSAEGIERLT